MAATDAAPQDLLEHLGREDFHRKRRQREGEDRASTHGVDVREGVRRGNPSEEPRIVDDGREEVDRLDDGVASGDPVDRGVVRFGVADEQVRIGPRRQLRQDLGKVELRDLARAAGARRERRERAQRRRSFLRRARGRHDAIIGFDSGCGRRVDGRPASLAPGPDR